jgi:hypothetical protein
MLFRRPVVRVLVLRGALLVERGFQSLVLIWSRFTGINKSDGVKDNSNKGLGAGTRSARNSS